MNTGTGKTASNSRSTGLRFETDRLVVLFADGREVHVPLRMYPTLNDASIKQREAWTLIGPSKAFHWPALDLDLSIDGLIQGLREAIPSPPKSKAAQKSA